VKLIYSDCTDCVKTNLGASEWFETSGVKHGSVFSPILFNAMMDKIVHKGRGVKRRPDKNMKETSVTINTCCV
jgi:hypothetical protein